MRIGRDVRHRASRESGAKQHHDTANVAAGPLSLGDAWVMTGRNLRVALGR